MKQFNRKLKGAFLIAVMCLVAFVGFSKAGLIFTEDNLKVVTVTATERRFDPNKYVAAMKSYTQSIDDQAVIEEETTTTVPVTTTTTTAAVTTTVQTTVPTTTTSQTMKTIETTWTGDVLTKQKGVVQGPSGRETYYNLNMSSVVSAMRRIGYSEEEYPYWVRDDGVKMLGSYVIVAADFKTRPKGTILESSLGMAIVCDTGSFVNTNPTQLDIAVSW